MPPRREMKMGLGNKVKFPKNIAETTLEPGRTGWASDRKKGEIRTGEEGSLTRGQMGD